MKKQIVVCLVLYWSYVGCMENKYVSEEQEAKARKIQGSKSTGSPVQDRVKRQASLERLLQEEGCKEPLRSSMSPITLRALTKENK